MRIGQRQRNIGSTRLAARVLAAASLLLAGLPSTTALAGHWSRPVTIDSIQRMGEQISCSAPSFCMVAVGDDTVLTDHGGRWSAPERLADGTLGGFTQLSCTSTTFCLAAAATGRAAIYDGSSWGAVMSIGGVGAAPGSLFRGLRGVSCASASFCVAASGSGTVSRYDGASWTAPQRLANMILGPVSCVSATFCVAIGDARSGGKAFTYNGRRWRATPIASKYVLSVSCPSARFCAAVSPYLRGDTVTFNGRRWSRTLHLAPYDGLDSVSCTSARFCVASGSSGAVRMYNGRSWKRVRLERAPGPYGLHVSCASRSFCVAVDDFGRAFTYS